MSFVSTQQQTTQNDKGYTLAKGALNIAAGGSDTVAESVAAVDGNFVKLNLSLPAPANWANCYFELFVNNRLKLTIEDQAAQFIDEPWKVPYSVKANDVVRIDGFNASGGVLRFAAYIALDVHEIENVRVI